MSEDLKVSKAMANLFYEQCSGSTSGHMSHIPNSPILFGITGAHSTRVDSIYSISKTEFREFLLQTAEHLKSNNEF